MLFSGMGRDRLQSFVRPSNALFPNDEATLVTARSREYNMLSDDCAASTEDSVGDVGPLAAAEHVSGTRGTLTPPTARATIGVEGTPPPVRDVTTVSSNILPAPVSATSSYPILETKPEAACCHALGAPRTDVGVCSPLDELDTSEGYAVLGL